jgi:hypothetical protein
MDQEFANLLTERYEYAAHEILHWSELKKAQSFTHDDFAEWNRREPEWTTVVRQLLEQHGCGPQVIARLWTIQEGEATTIVEHNLYYVSAALSMFSERLKRLESIINDYAEVPILKDR